jgi:hypothetical protein
MVAEFQNFVVSSFSQVRKGSVEVVEGDFALRVSEKKVTITAPGFSFDTTLSKVQQSKIKASVIVEAFEAHMTATPAVEEQVPEAVEEAPEMVPVAEEAPLLADTTEETIAPEVAETTEEKRAKGTGRPEEFANDYDYLKHVLATDFGDKAEVTSKELVAFFMERISRKLVQAAYNFPIVKKSGEKPALLPVVSRGVYRNSQFKPE